MFTDWIQAGETFHLSEQLRALIAQDCYLRYQGTNYFRLDEVPSPTTTTGINSLHTQNSYLPKLLVARSLYLLTNHELGHVLQTSAVYILELPAYLNRHMMPNTPPPSPFLLHPNREDHMVVTPQDENLRLAIPPGVYLQLQSRSGLALRGVTMVGGVIDSDYRGPTKVILHNSSDQNVIIAKGQRVTSGVFLPTVSVMFHAEDVLPPTVRGSAGFGSSD